MKLDEALNQLGKFLRKNQLAQCNATVEIYEHGEVLRSYSSPVVITLRTNGRTYLGPDHVYSHTTAAQITRYLGLNSAQRRAAVKSGIYTVLPEPLPALAAIEPAPGAHSKKNCLTFLKNHCYELRKKFVLLRP